MRTRITPFLNVCLLIAFAALPVCLSTALALELSDEAKMVMEADAKARIRGRPLVCRLFQVQHAGDQLQL